MKRIYWTKVEIIVLLVAFAAAGFLIFGMHILAPIEGESECIEKGGSYYGFPSPTCHIKDDYKMGDE